jgi:hypothetical protein
LSAALLTVICADAVRPSTGWFAGAVMRGGHLIAGRQATRDTEGFARNQRLTEQLVQATADTDLHPDDLVSSPPPQTPSRTRKTPATRKAPRRAGPNPGTAITRPIEPGQSLRA